MRDYIRLAEGANGGFVSIHDIPDPEVRKACCETFNNLARQQRGVPERMGGASYRNPHLHPNGTGLYTWLTEHVGDLTHRMAGSFSTGVDGYAFDHPADFGYGAVKEKVIKAVGYLRHGSWNTPFDVYFRQQVENNYNYAREHPEKAPATLKEWWTELEEAGIRYADAHRELPVYNSVQWFARQAAIDVGEMEFGKATLWLTRLESHLASSDLWAGAASLVLLGPDGKPQPYTG